MTPDVIIKKFCLFTYYHKKMNFSTGCIALGITAG